MTRKVSRRAHVRRTRSKVVSVRRHKMTARRRREQFRARRRSAESLRADRILRAEMAARALREHRAAVETGIETNREKVRELGRRERAVLAERYNRENVPRGYGRAVTELMYEDAKRLANLTPEEQAIEEAISRGEG